MRVGSFLFVFYKNGLVQFCFKSIGFVPRSVNLKTRFHSFGVSKDLIDVDLRLEGLSQLVTKTLFSSLNSEELLRKVMNNPESLMKILQNIANNVRTFLIIIGKHAYSHHFFFELLKIYWFKWHPQTLLHIKIELLQRNKII